MSNKTVKFLPIWTLLLVSAVLFGETYCECDIDLESYMEILIAIGIGGIPLKVVKDAIAARKECSIAKYIGGDKNNN